MTVKNYAEQGGDKWVVNGTLEITTEGEVLLDGVPLTRAVNQAESSATTIAELKADFNALLAKLRAAGLMDQSHG
ncbi:Head fiber protein [Anaeroselena agilis]|uniref:Head fiber protein n=1 Tax=Anaeroselena agilis TaxID=3063788 RepID=A0ABU3NTW5_9FIRM|nr:Head fiber protein [Selenomonadales bacterium 4137-cl]